MLYRVVFFVLAFGAPVFLIAQAPAEKPLDSRIDSVTVFLDGAQVHRSAQADVPLGRSKWVLKGLSPFIDPQSVQIRTNSELILLSVNHRLNFLEEIDKDALQEEILVLQDSLQVLNALANTLAEEEQLLKSNRAIGGTQTGIRPEDLKTVNAYYVERIQDIRLKTLALQKRIQVHSQRIQQLQNQMYQGRKDPKKAKGEVVFEIECKRAQKAQLVASYIVGQAGWFPFYDIRSRDVKSDIELVYRARVFQSTGEDWNKVRLAFSNADPGASGIVPVLTPWYLNFNQVVFQRPQAGYMPGAPAAAGGGFGGQAGGRVTDEEGNPMPGVNVMVAGTTIGTMTDYNGNFSLIVPPDAQSLTFSFIGFSQVSLPVQPNLNVTMSPSDLYLEEIVITGKAAPKPSQGRVYDRDEMERQQTQQTVPTTVIEHQTNVSFRVDLPYTLPSDGEIYTVDLTSYFIPAYYEYQSVPKLDESAFLIARITGWEQYNLLEGEANLFFEDTYVGKSILDVRYVSDTLDVSLGRDKNVLVKRTKVVDYAKRRLIGANKIETRSWKIEVRNNKAQAINLVLTDQLPISQQSEIVVTPQDLSGAVQKIDTGELRWSFSLEPRGKKEWQWGYEVKYPKDRTLILE